MDSPAPSGGVSGSMDAMLDDLVAGLGAPPSSGSPDLSPSLPRPGASSAPVLDVAAGTFKYLGKTYVSYIELGGKKKALTHADITNTTRETLLKNAATAFADKVKKVDNVSRAVFSLKADKLHLETYGSDDKRIAKHDLELNTPAASITWASLAQYETTSSHAYVGFTRVQGEQTCYANAFLQMLVQAKKGEKLGSFPGETSDPHYVERKAVWKELVNIQKQIGKATPKTPVDAGHVKAFLAAVEALDRKVNEGQASKRFHDPKAQQDIADLWDFMMDQLGAHLKIKPLPDALALVKVGLMPPEDDTSRSSVQGLLDQQIQDAAQGLAADQLPKILPIPISRMNLSGKKISTYVDVNEEIDVNGTKYRLVAAATLTGNNEGEGHYVSYRRYGDNEYAECNDATTIKRSLAGTKALLGTTATMLIYEKQ